MKRFFLTALVSLGLSFPAFAALYTYNGGLQNGGTITDGSLNGLADTINVSGIVLFPIPPMRSPVGDMKST